MLTSRINFTNFKFKSKKLPIKKELNLLLKRKNEVINSLSNNYKDNFNKKIINKYKKFSNFRIIGMGGSSLGAKAIYDFLKKKIKKSFTFIDNLQPAYDVKKKNIY